MGEKQERYPLCNAHRHSLSNSSSCYLTWLQVTNVFKAWFQKMRKTPNQIFNFVDCVSIKKQNTMFSKTRANKTSVVCLCLFIKSFYTTSLFLSLRKKTCRSPSKASKCQQGHNPPLINILFDPFSRKSSLAGNAAASRGGHAYQQNVQRTSKEGHTSGLKSQLGL